MTALAYFLDHAPYLGVLRWSRRQFQPLLSKLPVNSDPPPLCLEKNKGVRDYLDREAVESGQIMTLCLSGPTLNFVTVNSVVSFIFCFLNDSLC